MSAAGLVIWKATKFVDGSTIRKVMMEACPHTGTIPSKMRKAISQLTGFAVKALYGNASATHGRYFRANQTILPWNF
jgi:hypothetical protein